MRRIIITGSEGFEHDALASITLPLMLKYAERHNYSIRAFRLAPAAQRPSSWKKLIAICGGFADHDEVLWLDSDVVISDGSHDFFESIPADCLQAMVRHQTCEGDVPNAGVWFLRRPMLPHLMLAAMQDDLVSHKWWEQAAMLRFMGFAVDDGICSHRFDTSLYEKTHWLDESWNVWRGTPHEVPAYFRHACGTLGQERHDLVKRWADAAT